MVREQFALSAELYWKIKAILVGIQMKQSQNKNITWHTSLEAVLEEMAELEKN